MNQEPPSFMAGSVRVWDVAQDKLLMILELDEPVFSKDSFYPFPWGLCWSPNGKYVAACFPKSSRVYALQLLS